MVTQIFLMEKPQPKEAVAFVGLPGIGLVGKIVVDYLVKELKPKKIADVYSDAFPPAVITRSGILELFTDHIYHLETKGKHFYFVSGPVIPNLEQGTTASEVQYDFARALVAALKDLKVSQIYTLAGLNVGDKRMTITPGVVVSATDKGTLEKWKATGARASGTDDTIWGYAGLTLGIGKVQGIPGACLMGETSAQLVYGDPGASKSVLALIDKQFKFNLKMDRIEAEAKEIETAFKKLAETMAAEEGHGGQSNLPYVR
ncbi:MAG: PAC2 family protein [Candidatus Diapherotrites archaeon]|nr:PAC2 family protein [Candidatus Diapherotrites archaeon]MDZ4256703.1 PAC2 family protein [archaeon]